DQERKLVMEEWNQSVAFHSSEASRSSGAHDVAIAANEDIIALLDEPSDIPGPEKSISHCCGYILDRYLQPVPPGAAGVLYLSIETIALNDAHKSTKLIENPFGPGTLYSTNKLVHNLNDGRIAVIGKADQWTNARNQKMMAKLAGSKGSGDGSAPRTAIEQALVKIWREVLRIEYVGIYDNFFELGGNSLLAIRVAAEAGHYGLHFIGRDLFRYQVIADLVTVVRLVEPDVAYCSMETRDWWPTLPNQRSYFDRNVVNPALWNVVILRKVASAANPRLLQLAIEQLIRKHSTLRLQFREFEGEWVQYLADESQSGLFYTFDLSHFDYATQLKELLRIGNQLNSSFRFNEGTLVRFALFHLGEQGIRFLIVVHHLICDAISAKILLRDLSLIYTRLNTASQPEEYTHNRPFLEWALLVHSQPAMAQAIAEQPYWAPRKTVSIPVDFPKGKNLVATADRVHIELSEAESAALIMQAQKRYQTSIDILLLWALATCMMEWQKQQFVVVTMITHGRECQWSHIDLSDAVGFFAMHYPLVLEIPSDIGLEAGVALVRTQLEAVPNEGLGHGMLRFIHNHKYVNQRIPLQEEGDISFNYLGDNDAPYNQSEIFTVAQEDTGSRLDPRAEGPYKLGLFSYISGGRIQGNWWFNLGIYKPQTIEALTIAFQQNLRRLL
ncbi:MAG TPA: condensation domain-containing protein, partial [Candidatus Angelobacter sp.]|nr:condensation domain-containing protein [Candidatus Angelobacter sp.]